MCNESVQQMTPLPVLVLVLGIGIVRYQSIGYWVLGVQLGIVLTLVYDALADVAFYIVRRISEALIQEHR